jgi:hypothetical protein
MDASIDDNTARCTANGAKDKGMLQFGTNLTADVLCLVIMITNLSKRS